ncbi:MAG: hypothetical protein NXI31_17335 [bacterium]|nr:hypothetical protein [bacterium]
MIVGLAAVTAAQVPPHAALLNPGNEVQDDLQVLRNGDIVHVLGTTAGSACHYSRSVDGGRSWSTQSTAFSGRMARLAIEDNLVAIGATDRGETWQTTTAPVSPAWDVEITIINGVIVTFWAQGQLILMSRSPDQGNTWTPPMTVAQGQATILTLSTFVEGQRIHLFWGPQGMHHQRSLDGGITWMPASNTLPTNLGGPTILGHGDTLIAPLVTLQRSFDFGATWQTDNSHGIGQISGADLHEDLIVLGGFSPNLFGTQVAISTDRGRTWQTTFLPGVVLADEHNVIAHGNTAWARFIFFSAGEFRSAWLMTDDLGATWESVAADSNQAVHVSDHGAIGFHRPRPQVIPSPPLRAFPFAGHTSLGQGSAGTGAFTPTLRGRGLALVGTTFDLELDHALGGATGAWFFALTTASTPLGSATLYLEQPIGPLFFTASGATGVAGAGAATYRFSTPANPVFAGIRIVSQAFVLDVGSPDGFAATRAIETWIN